ncbi:hypothetical protein tb265_15640 [Gemmatimonadetes bacterium T265]|nr:hypothetical protein tb265_15640 [Gemmatimonadetes bacterium T265]
MCGIVGVVGPASRSLEARLARACEVMRHRGPDDAGLSVGEDVAFGFRRLSILDLSAAGHQPMQAGDGRLTLVFNGEIYNFRELRRALEARHHFESHTDSEVLLHGFAEWGWEGLLARVDGMFAFAIWDAHARTLYAARDRVGKKPLYFSRRGGSLYFASTLHAVLELLPCTPDVSTAALDAYLTYQAVPAPMTMYEGVEHLPPAHALVFDADRGTTTVTRYWDLLFAPKLRESEQDVLEQTDTLLRASVRKRLVSDVPLGAFLSGGVDSGLIVSMMAQESSSAVEAVVIGFDDPKFDERQYARAVAQRWGVRLHEDVIGPSELRALPEIVWHYGQPLADVSIVPSYAVARLARRHVTVALNGDGGDEVFGGYARPVVARAAAAYRRAPAAARAVIAGALARQAHGRLRRAWMLAEAGRGSARDAFVYDRGFRSFRDEAYGPALQGAEHPDALYGAVWDRAPGEDDVDRALYGDFATYLPDQLLVKMDVATMAHSLEARSPFLDRALIEFAARIPTAVRLKGYATKYLLKRLAERYLPHDVIYRRKRGFVAPVGQWMSTAHAPLLRAVLDGRTFQRRGWVRPAFVRRMLDEHARGARDWGEQLWTLLVLETWARQSIDRTLGRNDPIDALREGADGPARPFVRHTGAAPIETMQIGMGWFGEEAGGLNRYYHGLTASLPDVGVRVRGVVAGSDAVVQTSGGAVEAMAPQTAPLRERWRRTRDAVRQFVADPTRKLVVSHFALYTYPALGLLRGRPLVVHFHGPWALESEVEGAGWASVRTKHRFETAVYRTASRCVVLSRAFERVLHERYGVPRDRIRVVPGAVDVDRFATGASRGEARRRLGWPADQPIVLAVRRLARRMGLEDLVDAVPEIRRRVPDVLVLIAGKGAIAGELQRRIDGLGVQDSVRMLGFVADEDLPLAYRAATVSVVPTVALEGFGLIVAESLAAGTPALVTPVGSLPEVVEGLSRDLVLGATGPAAIADGIGRALDGTLPLPDAAACERFARERYSWPVVAAQIRAVYEEALR